MNRHDAKPLVYGYLCVEESDEAQVAGWRKALAAFCAASDYQLGSIFIDNGVSAGSFARGGFIEMLAALRCPEAYGAVVPSLAHLSTDAFLQQVLAQMVRVTDSQLLVSTVIHGSSPEIELLAGPGAQP